MSELTAPLAGGVGVADVRADERIITLPRDFPKIVTLCGSTRFEKEYIQATRVLTLGGCIVISVGLFGHQEGLDMAGETKQSLDRLHLRKIDLADVVVVINPKMEVCCSCGKPCECGFNAVGASGYSWSSCCRADVSVKPYIGDSTRREIDYAKLIYKPVVYLYGEPV